MGPKVAFQLTLKLLASAINELFIEIFILGNVDECTEMQEHATVSPDFQPAIYDICIQEFPGIFQFFSTLFFE